MKEDWLAESTEPVPDALSELIEYDPSDFAARRVGKSAGTVGQNAFQEHIRDCAGWLRQPTVARNKHIAFGAWTLVEQDVLMQIANRHKQSNFRALSAVEFQRRVVECHNQDVNRKRSKANKLAENAPIKGGPHSHEKPAPKMQHRGKKHGSLTLLY